MNAHSDEEPAENEEPDRSADGDGSAGSAGKGTSPALILMAWVVVAVPTLWGVYQTLRTAMKLMG